MSKSKGLKELNLGGETRSTFGVIVAAREIGSGRDVVIHEPGPPLKALAAICQDLDLRLGDWKVVSVSTPSSIYRDLQGTRNTSQYGDQHSVNGEEYRTQDFNPQNIERTMLGRAGRADMYLGLPRRSAVGREV